MKLFKEYKITWVHCIVLLLMIVGPQISYGIGSSANTPVNVHISRWAKVNLEKPLEFEVTGSMLGTTQTFIAWTDVDIQCNYDLWFLLPRWVRVNIGEKELAFDCLYFLEFAYGIIFPVILMTNIDGEPYFYYPVERPGVPDPILRVHLKHKFTMSDPAGVYTGDVEFLFYLPPESP